MNTAITAAGNAWAMVVMLGSVPLLLHGLGTARFGTWVLLQTFSATMGWFSIADAGLCLSTTRAVATGAAVGDDRAAVTAARTGVAVLAAIAVVGAGAFALVAPVGLPTLFNTPTDLVADLQYASTLYAGTILAELLLRGAGSVLEGVQRVDLSRALDALRRTLAAVATVATAQAGGNLAAVAAASGLASAVALLPAAMALRRHLPRRESGIGFSWTLARDLVRYGWTVSAVNASGVLHRTMDRLIAGRIFGPHGVAVVEVATQLQNGASAVLAASSYVVMSSSSWLHARGDMTSLRELLLRGTRYSLLVTMPVVGVGVVLAGPVVEIWVGDRYTEAAGLTALALAYLAVTSPLQVGQNLLQGVGAASLVFRASVVAVILNLIASVALANAIGLVGLFIGTLVGAAVLIPLEASAVLRTTDTSLSVFLARAVVPGTAPALASATAAAIVAYVLPTDSPAVKMVGGVLAGGVALIAPAYFWGVRHEDRSALVSTMRRAPSAPVATEHAADSARDDSDI